MRAASRSTRLHRIAAVGGGLLGIAALAGCSPATTATSAGDPTPAPAGTSTSAATTPTTSAPSSASPAAGGLKDGTYSATGDYQSPGGPSAIGVTVSLKSGTIATVKVTPEAKDATARQYESQFASGVGAVAVGKPIKGLQVGAVSGSSLTSQGFEKALAAIQEKAAA